MFGFESQSGYQSSQFQFQSSIYAYMEETPKNYEGKPIVRVCTTCQKINSTEMESFSLGINQKVKNEMDVVDKKIKENSLKFSFSHGMCNLHLYQTFQTIPNITPERLESIKEKLKRNTDPVPCLLQNEPLRYAFMKGLFTKEMIQQELQSTQQSNQHITERFKMLAGIKD